MPNNWASYDSVADDYDRVMVSGMQGPPASDLIALMNLPVGGSILDVGTGTGAALQGALSQMGRERFAVGIDPAPRMLQVAATSCSATFAAASLPHLPFPDNTFDAASANFVINHIADYSDALREIRRVLGPQGKIGISSWSKGRGDDRVGPAWRAVCDRYVPPEALSRAIGEVLPSEAAFSTESKLHSVLQEAGFENVEVEEKEYDTSSTVDGYIERKHAVVSGRFAQHYLSPEQWQAFLNEATSTLKELCPDGIKSFQGVNLTVAQKSDA